MPRKIINRGIRRCVGLSMYNDDIIFLKLNGIDKSKFMRQAIRAYKNKEFEYDYLEGDYE